MAPLKQKEPSIDRSTEYEDFMKTLEVYHEKRGTTLEREPKVANRHIDLLRLYKRVLEEGGYDRASDTRGNPLAWRRIASEFLPANAQVTTLAFLVKTAYYKNLAAYEISTHHDKDPPPREILEDVTAKGGDLLNRTLENYTPKMSREAENLVNGRDSDGSDSEQRTPGNDKMDVDELANTPGRVTRALRHAPPQRVLFQPDMSSGRQTRSANQANSPTPGQANGVHGMSGASVTIANYEPRPLIPSSVRPVTTPANNPDHYNALRKKWIATRNARRGIYATKGMMLPGTGFTGPNIYIRALQALQSGLPGEVSYALHHLVKISHERGDKYQFGSFIGLAEALINRVLKVSSLFYDIDWDVQYDGFEDSHDVLNGTTGTPNLLEKIRTQVPLDVSDDLLPEEFFQNLGNINEAALVIRNMVMLEENASYLSSIPLIRDVLTIVLHLPRRSLLVELRHYALEIAEQLTKFWKMGAEDPLYQSLLLQLESDDRGVIITTLRTLSRISMIDPDARNLLHGVPPHIIDSICNWLLVEDEDLRNGCLDFLYQFTAVTENVELMTQTLNLEALVEQLVRLLMFNANPRVEYERQQSQTKRIKAPAGPPKLSTNIIDDILKIPDNRELSSNWLRTCYEEDKEEQVTQIAIWQAYNDTFNPQKTRREMMQAKDFIQNVSATFVGASAHIDQDPNGQNKYVIRGLKPRVVPVDPRTKTPYFKCNWVVPGDGDKETECGEYYSKPKDLWQHVITSHLEIQQDGRGGPKFAPEGAPKYICRWGGCGKFAAKGGTTSPWLISKHVQTHMPDTSSKAGLRQKAHRNGEEEASPPRVGATRFWLNTQDDDGGNAAGLPLASVLVLRNLARQLAKVDAHSEAGVAQEMRMTMGGGGGQVEKDGLVAKVFAPVKEQLYFVMAYNKSLREYIASLTTAIAAGDG
ncbi:hypothetical protein NA57DRAFT_57353 [Rhizodiscina lignyota]|uniref:RSC complex subunit Rsc9 n=1 Tax=Rhizodiscina lignyota TaxID=1504668 RepID=A0A9P4M8B5_9PEZI|nr:hypothetical protein NA57DRAFT_57353 [Rhizodiscina lignyota]